MRNVFLVSIVLAGCLVLGSGTGCGGGGGGGDATPPVPTLTAVTPPEGPMAGGTVLTLTGTGFSWGGLSVQVGGVFATAVGAANDTTITCTTPATTTRGPADVVVTTIGGSATLPGSYTYLDAFFGDYFLTTFRGETPTSEAHTEWGTLTADGLGQVTGQGVDQNTNGTLSSSPITPFPYTLDPDRQLTWNLFGGDPYRGGISATGDVAFTASNEGGTDPLFALLIRRSGSFNLASLNGLYVVLGITSDGTTETAFWGGAQFDGAGGVDVVVTGNQSGTIIPASPVSNDTYSVMANGSFQWTIATPGAPALRGGVLLGGDLVICAGGIGAAQTPIFAVFVRPASPAAVNTLNGPYFFGGYMGRAGAPTGWLSQHGTATSDAAGTLTFGEITVNTDGVLSTIPAGGTASYAVSGMGALQVGTGLSQGAGAVSPGGRFAAWAGAVTAGGNPQLWILVR